MREEVHGNGANQPSPHLCNALLDGGPSSERDSRAEPKATLPPDLDDRGDDRGGLRQHEVAAMLQPRHALCAHRFLKLALLDIIAPNSPLLLQPKLVGRRSGRLLRCDMFTALVTDIHVGIFCGSDFFLAQRTMCLNAFFEVELADVNPQRLDNRKHREARGREKVNEERPIGTRGPLPLPRQSSLGRRRPRVVVANALLSANQLAEEQIGCQHGRGCVRNRRAAGRAARYGLERRPCALDAEVVPAGQCAGRAEHVEADAALYRYCVPRVLRVSS